jgi:hypothetical protein
VLFDVGKPVDYAWLFSPPQAPGGRGQALFARIAKDGT